MIHSDGAKVLRTAGTLLLGLAACSSAPVTTGPPEDAEAEVKTDAAKDMSSDAGLDVMVDATTEVPADAGSDTSSTADAANNPSICTGGDEIRLAIRIAGGGQPYPGQDMLGQNGWSFLLVDGSCTAWVLKDYAGRLVRAVLSAADEEELATTLSLSSWDRISVPVGGGCVDASGMTFRFGDRRLGGAACGVSPNSAWGRLMTAGDQAISHVATLGSPWDGDVRYLLLEENSVGVGSKVVWPLASSLKAIGVPMFGYRADAFLSATGDDAAKLRAIRTIPKGDDTRYYTRVTDASGGTYQLFVRDALPFEQPSGGLPPGVF